MIGWKDIELNCLEGFLSFHGFLHFILNSWRNVWNDNSVIFLYINITFHEHCLIPAKTLRTQISAYKETSVSDCCQFVSFSRSLRSQYCVISANNSCQFKARARAGVTIDLQSRTDRQWPETALVTLETDSFGQEQTSDSSSVWSLVIADWQQDEDKEIWH